MNQEAHLALSYGLRRTSHVDTTFWGAQSVRVLICNLETAKDSSPGTYWLCSQRDEQSPKLEQRQM